MPGYCSSWLCSQLPLKCPCEKFAFDNFAVIRKVVIYLGLIAFEERERHLISRVIDLCVHVQPGNFEISCEVCKKSTPLGFLRGTRPGNWYSWPRFRVSRLGRKQVRTRRCFDVLGELLTLWLFVLLLFSSL